MAHTINRSALVWHSAERMFALVSDIPDYPQFLPWCSAAEVHEVTSTQVLASIEVAKGGVRHRFTTRNLMDIPGSIRIELVEGPFRALQGRWFFEPLDVNASKVVLELDFEFSGRLSRMAFGGIFSQAANSLVDAFCARADALYGKGKG
jgi:ribosome-associated toxin RatA of RatAB toxin-antitoxin module